MTTKRLANKRVIITGAGQGIGVVYARALAAAGASLAICDLKDPVRTRDELSSSGTRVLSGSVDITDAAAVSEFVARSDKELGPTDVLVNNAALFGTLTKRSFLEIPAEEWDHVMSVNTRGVVEFVKAVVPGMKRNAGGKIVNIASTTVYQGTPFMMHYVASKGAVIAMTRVMARELGQYGITVNCISPGLIMNEADSKSVDQTTYAAQTFDPETLARVMGARSLKRQQYSRDLTGPLLFLATSDSDFMTGQTIIVDGGAIFS
jgi:NAD(P)-dependent dehydrogenase (short-subunit alcohol dehydrogenase family)